MPIWETDGVPALGSDSAESLGNGIASGGISRKRKRGSNAESIHLATPTSPTVASDDTPDHLDGAHRVCKRAFPTYTTAKDFLDSMKACFEEFDFAYQGNDQDFIQIAQLVADQKTMQNGFALCDSSISNLICTPKEDTLDASLFSLENTLMDILPGIQQCDLKSFLDIDLKSLAKVVPSTGDLDNPRQSYLLPRNNRHLGEVIFRSQIPFVSVQRGKDMMEVTPPALYFWEELGLAPVQQSKEW